MSNGGGNSETATMTMRGEKRDAGYDYNVGKVVLREREGMAEERERGSRR